MDIRRVDLNLLVVFETIYRTRNLTEAGDVLGLTQSAVSHALRRLRDKFQDPLFVRVSRGVEPTQFAEDLASRVVPALGHLHGVLDELEFNPATSTRHFRVVITDGEHFVIPELGHYLELAAPGVSLETFNVPAKDLRETMARGDFDLAMGFIPKLGPGFHHRLLFKDSFVCMVRKGHRVIEQSLTLQQYLGASHVLTRSGYGDVIEQALRQNHERVRIALRLNRFLSIPSVVARTDMIATVPKSLAEFFEPYLLRLLPVPLALPDYEVNLLWHERFHYDPGNQWLRRAVANVLKLRTTNAEQKLVEVIPKARKRAVA